MKMMPQWPRSAGSQGHAPAASVTSAHPLSDSELDRVVGAGGAPTGGVGSSSGGRASVPTSS
jgi:hypothetical protein